MEIRHREKIHRHLEKKWNTCLPTDANRSVFNISSTHPMISEPIIRNSFNMYEIEMNSVRLKVMMV